MVQLKDIVNKPVTRKQFISAVFGSLFAISSFPAILAVLVKGTPEQNMTPGFGTGAFGGDDVAPIHPTKAVD